jgi:hypothetical protein
MLAAALVAALAKPWPSAGGSAVLGRAAASASSWKEFRRSPV